MFDLFLLPCTFIRQINNQMISLITQSKMYCIVLSVVAAPCYYGDRGCITRRQWVYWTSRLEEALLSAPALDLSCSRKHLSRKEQLQMSASVEPTDCGWTWAPTAGVLYVLLSDLQLVWRWKRRALQIWTLFWFFFWQGLDTSRRHGDGRFPHHESLHLCTWRLNFFTPRRSLSWAGRLITVRRFTSSAAEFFFSFSPQSHSHVM